MIRKKQSRVWVTGGEGQLLYYWRACVWQLTFASEVMVTSRIFTTQSFSSSCELAAMSSTGPLRGKATGTKEKTNCLLPFPSCLTTTGETAYILHKTMWNNMQLWVARCIKQNQPNCNSKLSQKASFMVFPSAGNALGQNCDPGVGGDRFNTRTKRTTHRNSVKVAQLCGITTYLASPIQLLQSTCFCSEIWFLMMGKKYGSTVN